MPESHDDSPFNRLLKRLVRVPKHEIEEQEKKYQKSREREEEPAKPGQIIPRERTAPTK